MSKLHLDQHPVLRLPWRPPPSSLRRCDKRILCLPPASYNRQQQPCAPAIKPSTPRSTLSARGRARGHYVPLSHMPLRSSSCRKQQRWRQHRWTSAANCENHHGIQGSSLLCRLSRLTNLKLARAVTQHPHPPPSFPPPAPLQIADCVSLAPTTLALTAASGHGGCSVWLLRCSPLCDALASNTMMYSPSLVHQLQVWASPADKVGAQLRTDEHPSSNAARLLPLHALNLVAVCLSSGAIHLLNTHGDNFTIRSSFSRHTQPVRALALCNIEGVVISGGVSR